MNKIQGLINKILPFSAIDGPGNRMVIFMQGCNLNCLNCHNPHTIGICNLCGTCVYDCPVSALEIIPENPPWINYDNSRCIDCDHCLEICPINSSPKTQLMEVDEIIRCIRQVEPFISGITLSGGEATIQGNFVHELFTTVKTDTHLTRLTTFIDSNGTAPLSFWDSILPVLDGVMVDLKALDSAIHHQLTGSGNDQVLKTIPYLYQKRKLYEVRLLIIPEFNSSDEQINATIYYLSQNCNNIRIRLIPFRHHGVRQEGRISKEADMNLINKITLSFNQAGFQNIVTT